MLSRVADNLYWFGRYLSRVENTARLVQVNALLLIDLPRRAAPGWEPLIDIVGAGEGFRKLYETPDEASVVRFLALDERYSGSIASSLKAARETLRSTRDYVPGDLWEKISELDRFVAEQRDRPLARGRRHDFLNRIVDGALVLRGLLLTHMSRDVGFEILRLGTNLEQADMTTRILDVRSIVRSDGRREEGLDPIENFAWMSVLRSLLGYQMYRRHVRERVTAEPVVRFLLQNREFPRSVTFCLLSVERALSRMPQRRAAERSLHRTLGLVRDANVEALVAGDLHAWIDEIQLGLAELHEAVTEAYFRI